LFSAIALTHRMCHKVMQMLQSVNHHMAGATR
jgi:hypothetical protein